MESLAHRIARQVGLLVRVGIVNYLRYRLTAKGNTLKIRFMGKDILIRKGTPDLGVALMSLDGEFDELAKHLPQDYKGIIVDAGGYIGTSVLALRDLFPYAQIIVIEPSHENIKILRRNIAHLDNVEIIQAALVGKKRKSITLRDRDTGEAGFTTVTHSPDNEIFCKLHETPALTLGELGVKPAEIGILKLDIEGSEAEVIRHDAKSLKPIKVIFAELHDRFKPDCSRLFFEFSQNRKLIKDDGEKYLSVKRER